MGITGGGRATLADALGGRDNALNAIRLALAVAVIFAHAYPLTGRADVVVFGDLDPGGWAVAGFFTISGFLIARSRARLPFRTFLARRARRIFPALWVALIATAAVASPIAAAIHGTDWPGVDAARYVMANAAIVQTQWGIGDTLASNPYPDAWNGSLWTLQPEFLAYLMAGALVPLLLRARIVGALVLHGLFVLWAFQQPDVPSAWLGGFFTAGMVAWAVADRVRPSWWVAGAGLVGWVGVCSIGLGRELGGLPFAALMLALGALLPVRRCRTNDLSYGTYVLAFPVEQLLAAGGLAVLGAPVFAVVATALVLPLAAVSWRFVEQPALRARRNAPRTAEAERGAGVLGRV